jgi:hypothetical protein
MSTEITELDIRSRAYELWLAAGSPEGRNDEFRHEARARLADPSANSETIMGDEVAERGFDEDGPKAVPATTK